MDYDKRSPWRPWPILDPDGTEYRYMRCLACERYYGAAVQPRPLIQMTEHVRIGPDPINDVLPPGWYCRECLHRAKRSD